AADTRQWAEDLAAHEAGFFDALTVRPYAMYDMPRLRVWADAVREVTAAVDDLEVECDEDPDSVAEWEHVCDLPDEVRTQAVTDVENTHPAWLYWHVPRDDKGRMQLGLEILLAHYTQADTPGRAREVWLLARTPKRRKDPQVITLGIEPTGPTTKSHVWQHARYRWDWEEGG